MNFFYFLIQTNIFISLAAVALTLETQIQLGQEPTLHPYIFIILFATLFEYNLHRFITVIKNPNFLSEEKHGWVKQNRLAFYVLVIACVFGFIVAIALAKKEVLATLFPIGVITLLYSVPILKIKNAFFRLREIPLLKIFLISLVWSFATILLPVVQSSQIYDSANVLLMLAERFTFVFAISIPFDIRDMKTDRELGIKTIPLLIGEKNATRVSTFALFLFLVLCVTHYTGTAQNSLLLPLIISALSTYLFITLEKVRQAKHYHYFVLDGTLLLQGLLVILFYWIL